VRYIEVMVGMNRAITILIIYSLLIFSIMFPVWGEDQDQQNELIERMIRIVLENNPTLKSQERLVRESQEFPEPRPTLAMNGLSFNVGSSIWDPDTNSFSFVPAASLGISFSLGDPARVLNSLNVKKQKEGAKQDYHQLKNSMVSDIFANVREILKLKSQSKSLEKLKAYLEDYSNLIEKQVKAGVIELEPDKLWDLKERIMGIEVEIQDVKNKLNTIKLEGAIRLGGDAWGELLELFKQLD
jgi:tRNA nucleotidyltransferase/poly(A) polymerase